MSCGYAVSRISCAHAFSRLRADVNLQEKVSPPNEALKDDMHLALFFVHSYTMGDLTTSINIIKKDDKHSKATNLQRIHRAYKGIQGILGMIGIATCSTGPVCDPAKRLTEETARAHQSQHPLQIFRNNRFSPRWNLLRAFVGPQDLSKVKHMQEHLQKVHDYLHQQYRLGDAFDYKVFKRDISIPSWDLPDIEASAGGAAQAQDASSEDEDASSEDEEPGQHQGDQGGEDHDVDD